jgi:guanine deaminase
MAKDFMKEAIKEAYYGMRHNHGGPFGAVVVCKGKIVSRAHNCVLKTNDPTAHAEVNAIRKASRKLKRYNLSGCEIYTTAEPCPMCFSAIHWARIKKIYFGASIADAKKAGFNELEISAKDMKKHGKSKVELREKVLCKECTLPFKEYVKTKKRTY